MNDPDEFMTKCQDYELNLLTDKEHIMWPSNNLWESLVRVVFYLWADR